MSNEWNNMSPRVRTENLAALKPLGLYERQQRAREKGLPMPSAPVRRPLAAVTASNGGDRPAAKPDKIRPLTDLSCAIPKNSKHGRAAVVPVPTKISETIQRGKIAMKHRLTDLNDHLFEQMKRLGNEDLKGEALQEEVVRSKAISGIARDIVANASTVLEVLKFGAGRDLQVPGMLLEAPDQLPEG